MIDIPHLIAAMGRSFHPLIIRLAIAAATILVWAVLVWLLAAPAPPPPPDVYAGIAPDPHLLALDKQALEQAYKERIVKLFGVWLTDTRATEAARFQNGLQIVRRGYTTAMRQIEHREQELQRR